MVSYFLFLSSARFSKKKKFKPQQTAGNMTVKFTSDRRSEAAGAKCSVQCAKAAPTPAPTTATGNHPELLSDTSKYYHLHQP